MHKGQTKERERERDLDIRVDEMSSNMPKPLFTYPPSEYLVLLDDFSLKYCKNLNKNSNKNGETICKLRNLNNS